MISRQTIKVRIRSEMLFITLLTLDDKSEYITINGLLLDSFLERRLDLDLDEHIGVRLEFFNTINGGSHAGFQIEVE